SDLWGYDPQNWTIADAWRVIHPEDRPGYRAARIAYLKSNQRHGTFVYRARNARSGMWRWQRDQTLAKRDANGMAVRLVGHIIDINDEREREQALREALEQQTATAEVLQVINTSPGDVRPVFDAMLEKATRLCDAPCGHFRICDGEVLHIVAARGASEAYMEFLRTPAHPHPNNPLGRMLRGERVIVCKDAAAEEPYRSG